MRQKREVMCGGGCLWGLVLGGSEGSGRKAIREAKIHSFREVSG